MAFGGGNQDIDIVVKLVQQQAEAAAAKLSKDLQDGFKGATDELKKVNENLSRLSGEANRAGQNVRSAFDGAKGTVVALDAALNLFNRSLGFVSKGAEVVAATMAALDDAARLEGIQNSFNSLQKSIGELGDRTLAKLRTATRGYISDAELMQKANQALLLGLPMDQFDQLAGSAIKLGRAMGIDATASIESLTIGIGRQSKEILDNLGVTVSAEEAYRNFAEANNIIGRELTDTERKAAFAAEAMDKIAKAAEAAGETFSTAADAKQRLNAAMENASGRFAKAASESTNLKTSVNELSNVVEASPAPSLFGTIAAEATAMAVSVAAALGKATNDLLTFNTRSSEIAAGFRALRAEALNNDPVVQLGRSFGGAVDFLFDSLKGKVEAGGKQLQAAVQDAFKADKDATKFSEKFAADAFGFDTLTALTKKQAGEIRKELESIYRAQLDGSITSEQAAKRFDEYAKTVTKSSAQLKDFEKIAKRAYDTVKKSVEENRRASERASKDGERDLKRQQDELKRFGDQVRQALDVAVPADFQRKLEEAFAASGGNNNKLAEALEAIGAEAQQAKVDIQALTRAVQQLNKVQEAGGFGPGNAAGEQEFGRQQDQAAQNRQDAARRQQQRVQGNAALQGADLLGIDTSQITDEMAAAMEQALQTAMNTALDALFEGLTSEDLPALMEELGTAIGGLFGPFFALVGQFIGRALGELFAELNDELAGTKERKKIDAYFGELFNAERIAAVINGEIVRINDLVFEGNTAFGGDVDFGSAATGFFDVLNSKGEEAAAGVTALGAAFGEMAGIAEEQSRLIGAALVNNVGMELENLRALVKATGKSFDELADAMLQAFYEGILTVEEFYNGLKKIEELFSVGFPDAVGDVDRALQNMNDALEDGRGSRALIDSIRDAAAEAEEVGLSFPDLVARIGESLGLTAQQTALLLEFLKSQGIDTVEELKDASIAQLIAFLEAIRRIKEEGAATVGELPSTPGDPTEDRDEPTIFKPGGRKTTGGSGGRSGRSESQRRAEERKRELEREREELFKLLTASEKYSDILDELNAQTITQAEASKRIRELYGEIASATKELERAEEAYRKALEKRGKSQKEVADLAKRVKDAQERVDDLTERANESAKNAIPKFDISGALKITQTVNELAVVAQAAGVNLDGLTSTLVEGFLRGKISITEFRTELDKLEETFGDGIPGAMGDVKQALDNLREGGLNGGLFSIDAFKDVFSEFEELFSERSSENRKRQFAQLTKEVDEANRALQDAIAGGAAPADIDRLRTQFDAAKKSLDDFNNTPAKAGLEDLRSELAKTLAPDQVEAFFRALQENNIATFDDVKNAGPEAITRILASLDELGFGFGETSERVKGIISELDKATVAQTDGKDVLKEALDLVTGFNTASEKLKPSFDAAAAAVSGMEGPLASIATKVSETVNLLARLDGQTFRSDLVLNVRVQGQNGAVGLVEDLFGDGSGTSDDAGGNGPGLSPDQRRAFEDLRRRRKNGRLSAADEARYQRLLERRGA